MDIDKMQLGANFIKGKTPFSDKRRPLTDKQQQALQTLGACFYCRETGHLARDCPEKPKGGQDRRALPGKPLVRLLPPKERNRSMEVEGETIILTRDNFRKQIMKLDEDDRALVIGDLLE